MAALWFVKTSVLPPTPATKRPPLPTATLPPCKSTLPLAITAPSILITFPASLPAVIVEGLNVLSICTAVVFDISYPSGTITDVPSGLDAS